MQWFEVAPFVGMHTATSWEEGSKVHLVISRCELCANSTSDACFLKPVSLLCASALSRSLNRQGFEITPQLAVCVTELGQSAF